MKKLFSVLFLIMCLILTGCSEEAGNTRKRKQKDDEPTAPRTIEITENLTGHNYLEYEFDFDSDEKEEDIEIEITSNPDDGWDSEMHIAIGDYEKDIEVYGNWIDAVYICDIDTEDGVYDLAVITNEMSDDPVIRIFNYASGLPQHKFLSRYDETVNEDMWIGYAVSYYFNVNDDDTITIEMQTPSYGMWSVYRTYERNSDGVFCEIKPEKYEILPDFMEKAYMETMTGEELEMWEKGYILAHSDYDDGEFLIETGEYIKPLYDDGNNNIYVEKEDGTGGWMFIGYDQDSNSVFNRDEFNNHFFFLAG